MTKNDQVTLHSINAKLDSVLSAIEALHRLICVGEEADGVTFNLDGEEDGAEREAGGEL